MGTTEILVASLASVFCGILGVVISTVYYNRYERRRRRLDTFRRFFSNRYDLLGDEFSRALNEVFVIFNDSEEIMKALSEFHTCITARRDAEDALLRLHKAICEDLGISHKPFNDAFFLKPFNTRPSSMLAPATPNSSLQRSGPGEALVGKVR